MDRTATPEALVRALADTPTRIEAAARHLSAAEVGASPEPGAWSPNQILWHIRACADVYGEHIARILDEDAPAWRHASPRARMKKSRYDQVPFAESFVAFAAQRETLVARLANLPSQAWQRLARVCVEQRESPLTLHERIRGMAHHEAIHCTELERACAAVTMGGNAT